MEIIKEVAKRSSTATTLLVGAGRQIAAEASKIYSDVQSFDGLALWDRIVVEPATRLWMLIENESSPDVDKFPHGFADFDLMEETIEGAGMALPGVLAVKLAEFASKKRVPQPIRFPLYNIAGQLSYQFLSQNLGPLLHEKLGVSDFDLSLQTIQQLIEVFMNAN